LGKTYPSDSEWNDLPDVKKILLACTLAFSGRKLSFFSYCSYFSSFNLFLVVFSDTITKHQIHNKCIFSQFCLKTGSLRPRCQPIWSGSGEKAPIDGGLLTVSSGRVRGKKEGEMGQALILFWQYWGLNSRSCTC
jgi:hypothetical protein